MTPLFPRSARPRNSTRSSVARRPLAVVDRYADLLDTVDVLRAQPRSLPRVEFVDDLRLRLMTRRRDRAGRRARRRTPPRDHHDHHTQPPARHRRRRPGHRRRHRRHGRRRRGCAARRRALPDQARHREAGTAVRFERRRQGPRPAQPGHHPPRRGAARSRPGRQSRRRARRPRPSTPSAAPPTAGADRLFAAYQGDGDAEDIAAGPHLHQRADGPTRRSSSGKPRQTDAACSSTPPTRSPTSTSRPACSAAPAGRRTRSLPPAALSAGAGAAAPTTCSPRPVVQARADIADRRRGAGRDRAPHEGRPSSRPASIPHDPGARRPSPGRPGDRLGSGRRHRRWPTP